MVVGFRWRRSRASFVFWHFGHRSQLHCYILRVRLGDIRATTCLSTLGACLASISGYRYRQFKRESDFCTSQGRLPRREAAIRLVHGRCQYGTTRTCPDLDLALNFIVVIQNSLHIPNLEPPASCRTSARCYLAKDSGAGRSSAFAKGAAPPTSAGIAQPFFNYQTRQLRRFHMNFSEREVNILNPSRSKFVGLVVQRGIYIHRDRVVRYCCQFR